MVSAGDVNNSQESWKKRLESLTLHKSRKSFQIFWALKLSARADNDASGSSPISFLFIGRARMEHKESVHKRGDDKISRKLESKWLQQL